MKKPVFKEVVAKLEELITDGYPHFVIADEFDFDPTVVHEIMEEKDLTDREKVVRLCHEFGTEFLDEVLYAAIYEPQTLIQEIKPTR